MSHEPRAEYVLSTGEYVATPENADEAVRHVSMALTHRTGIGPMMNVPIPHSYTAERGIKYRRINAHHVVEVVELAKADA